MSTKKLTPWFPGSVAPARPGWYECYGDFIEHMNTKSGRGIVMRHFDDARGWKWQPPGKTDLSVAAVYDEDKWRGLAEQPK